MSKAARTPDARLIAASATFIARDKRTNEVSRAADALPPGAVKLAREAEAETLHKGYRRRLRAIARQQATTPAGLRAKAAAVQQHWAGRPVDDGECGLLASIVSDLLRAED